MREYCPTCEKETLVMVDFGEGKWCFVCETPLNDAARRVDSIG